MRPPLIARLKKASHRELAKSQDLIVTELYRFFNSAVLHGGTAVWRCYEGNRFSEDIDVYIVKDIRRIDNLFESLVKKGFVVKKRKITQNSLYAYLQINRFDVRFEALFKIVRGSLAEYETIDGNFITVYTLLPEELIKEKVEAYLNRLKIRDLYDIFFLLRRVADKTSIRSDLKKLLRNFKEPEDESELKVLILEGIVPSSEKMVEYIKSHV